MRRELSVCELSPGEFTSRLDQVIAVYAAAMRPLADMLSGRRSIMAGHAVHPGFRALTAAENGCGEMVGFGYGFRGAAGQWWHETVASALISSHGAAVAAAWLNDSFEVAELHVMPEYQGRGIGTELLLRLTSGRPERTALLSTRDADSPARRARSISGWISGTVPAGEARRPSPRRAARRRERSGTRSAGR